MAKAISWALDSQAEVKAVYYEGNSIIYEGMPVCYNFDTTNNWTGYGAATLAAAKTYQGTTAEGELNEGKFLRVENPTDDNLLHFAGVVAGTKKVGQTGPCVLDIYVPNGAVVPVRAGVECTVGKTVLSIINATQYLGQPLSATQARPVAIAMETNATLDTTAGLILARLCPKEFIYQELTGDALDVAVAGTDNITVNRIKLTTAQTTGDCTALSISLTSTAQTAGSATALSASTTTVSPANTSAVYFGLTNTGTGADGFHVLQVRGNAYGTAIAGDVNGVYSQITMRAGAALASGSTVAGSFSKVHVLTGGGTDAGHIVAARFSLGLDTAITGKTAMFRFDSTTIIGKEVDYLFITAGLNSAKEDIGFTANTTHTTAATSKVGAIPVYFGNAGAVRWIYVFSDAGA